MIVKVLSHRQAAVRYIYDNGNEVSIIFGPFTYSDNHDTDYEHPQGMLESSTVEVMVFGNPSFVRWFEREYEGNPGGYILVDQISTIMKRADSRVYKPKQEEQKQ